MELNKLQLKAKVFQLIEPLRNISAIDDIIVSGALESIKSIKDADFDFIARLLIKEADCKNQKSATALLFIAENVSPETFMPLVMKELNSNKVDDAQKIFLINILSGLGVKIEPEDIGAFLINPDEAINGETLRFLENAIIDPEAQIDFLDFYFSASKEDRSELVNSVMADFEGDKLANIISSLALAADETPTLEMCLDILEKTRSLFAIKPMQYLSYLKNENKIAKRAHKFLQKMQMLGLYSEEKLQTFYENFMKDFDKPKVIVSIPDGNSNFSLVVSRKTKDGAYFVLFVALNLNLGPFSCFGFSSITKLDHDTVLNRFFSTSKKIYIDPLVGKKILNSLLEKRLVCGKVVPYEYYCWERLMDDVKNIETPFEDVLKEGLIKEEMTEFKKKMVYSSAFIDNWFYKPSKNNPVFSDLVKEVMSLDISNIQTIEGILSRYAKDKDIVLNIKSRILFLAFCLKETNMLDFANAYYSLLYDENEFCEFIKNILKRSLYEYVLSLKVSSRQENNAFKREDNNSDFALVYDYIETNWVEQ